MHSEKATVTATGLGGRYRADCSWAAELADGAPIRILITAKVRTTKIPVLTVGQVVRVVPSPYDRSTYSVDVSDVEWVSPSKLHRRIAESA